MNAKVTITIPIEKVHLKVRDMLEEVANESESASIDITAIAKNVLEQKDLLLQLEQIDILRKKLTLLDANLEDCYSILKGLVKYKTKEMEQKNAEEKPE
jgi:hypothetical protein